MPPLLRPAAPLRILRPHLSLRYRLLRHESTSTNAPPAPASSRPKPTFLRRNRTRVLWLTLSLTTGLLAGNLLTHTVTPPAVPLPGTHEDDVLMADLQKRIDEEFKVKVLRGKCLGVAKQLKGDMGGWVEVVPTPVAEGEVGIGAEREQGLVNSMRGARGLGVERLFWDRSEKKLVAVIWFGGALSGWPGVTHGGAIATALSSKLALAASLVAGSNGDLTAAATPQRLPGTGNHAKMLLPPASVVHEPAHLSISYVKPTYANDFYVIRVSPAIPLDQDPEHIVPSEPVGGHEYEATLETLDTRVCAKAKASFAASSAVQRVEMRVEDGVRGGYEQFKQWMWPSRQRAVSGG